MDSRTESSKRPRSPSGDFPAIASKVPKTHSNHLQINYLARQYPDNLPLVSVEDTMPAIIHLIGEYDGVLHRHESIAGNLGACPLGPILIKRFERLFDGPPRVLKSHGKDSPNVTWLDVVEFAKSKPEQFNLEKSRNGVRVCQFYTKQCRVEISEEDFVLIASGMPQKMIPPQPIIEDEEKELGALEILEKNLQQIIQIADQVSARARQLNHRLKNRRTAIVTRRENDTTLHSARQHRSMSPGWRESNGTQFPANGNSHPNSNAHSPSTGFVAVNAGRPGAGGADALADESSANLSSQFMFSHSNTDNVTIINGTSIKGASPTTRAELMKKFFTTQDRQARSDETPGSTNRQSSRPRPRASDAADYSAMFTPAPTTVAIPSTPSSLLPPPKSHHHEKDDGGPYKMEMVARMEELQRGERILPPCDRCRRLHMDCLKNLTACMGCTKKHAKCSWKDVKEEELREARAERSSRERAEDGLKETGVPVALPTLSGAPTPGSAMVLDPERHRVDREMYREHREPREPRDPRDPRESRERENREVIRDGHREFSIRRESAPTTGPSPGTPLAKEPSPRRAVSELQGRTSLDHDRRVGIQRHQEPAAEDDEGANHRLMQAIMDTVDHHARVAAAVKEGGPESLDRERERERERELEREHEQELERERKVVRA